MLRNLFFKNLIRTCTIQARLTEAQNWLIIFDCACKVSKNCIINYYLGLAAPTQLTRFWPARCLLNILKLMELVIFGSISRIFITLNVSNYFTGNIFNQLEIVLLYWNNCYFTGEEMFWILEKKIFYRKKVLFYREFNLSPFWTHNS